MINLDTHFSLLIDFPFNLKSLAHIRSDDEG